MKTKKHFVVMEKMPGSDARPVLIIKTSQQEHAEKMAQWNDMWCGDPENSFYYLQTVEMIEGPI